MEEARYSYNLRFNYKGFDSQVTLRADQDMLALLEEFEGAVDTLQEIGATPVRRWEEAKNGNSVQKPAQPAAQKPAVPAAPAKPAQAQPNSKPAAPAQPKAAPKSAPIQPGAGEDEVCPEHGISAPSNYGGLYCPTKLEDGSWCPWRSEG